MTNHRLLLSASLGLLATGLAQTQTIDWFSQNSVANSTENAVYKVKIDSAGNIITMGGTVRNGGGPLDGLVQKFSPSGGLIWQSWVSMDKFVPKDFGLSPAGEVLVCGYNQLGDLQRPAVFKVDSFGNPIWAFQELKGTSAGIAVHGDATFVTVNSEATDTEGSSIVTRLYDEDTNVVWARTHNGVNNQAGDFASGVSVDADRNVYVVGTSYRVTSGVSMRLIKYDRFGTRQWTRTYAGAKGWCNGAAVIAKPGGGCIITGVTFQTNLSTTADLVTVSVDAAGATLWSRTYDGPAHFSEQYRDMAMDSNGGVAIAVCSPGADQRPEAAIIRYSASGVALMKRRWVAGNDTQISSIACAPDGSVYAAGYFYGEVLSKAFLLKYSNSHQFSWSYKHLGGGRDAAFYGVAADANSHAIAGGWAMASNSLMNTLVMRAH